MAVLVGLRAITGVAVASAVPTMSSVHQKVEQRAGEEEQIRQDAEEVCPVLRDKKEGRNGEETEQRETHSRTELPSCL